MGEDTLMRQKLANRGGGGIYHTDGYDGMPGDGATAEQGAISNLVSTVIPATGGLLLVAPGVHRITANLTIPGHVVVQFSPGAVFAPENCYVLFNGAVTAAPAQKIFAPSGAAGRILFSRGSIDRLYPEWWGADAMSDGDDFAALQAALTCSIAYYPITVQLLPGVYRTSQRLVVGTLGARRDGFRMVGPGMGRCTIRYTGPKSDGALHLLNMFGHHLDGFTVEGEYDPAAFHPETSPGALNDYYADSGRIAFGILLDCDNNSSAGNASWGYVGVQRAMDGIKIGRTLADVNGMPSHAFQKLSIGSCRNALHIVGSNTDGVHIFELETSGVNCVLRVENGRNIHVHSGQQTNPDARPFYADFIYMHATGILGGGPYSIRNLRLEASVTLLRLGGDGTSNPGSSAQVVLDGLSCNPPSGQAAPVQVVYWGVQGSLDVRNCMLGSPGSHFFFEARNSSHVSLELVNNMITHSNPDAAHTLIQGTGVTEGDHGGLRATLRGNFTVHPQTLLISGRIRDRVIRITPTQFNAHTQTVLQDLGGI